MTAAKKKSGKKSPAKSQNRPQKKPGTGKRPAAPINAAPSEPEPVKKKQSKRRNPGKKSREKPEKNLGRPPVPYDPKRHPEWVRGLASRGATRPEICTAMKISHGTLNAWMKKYPDFLAALQVGRNETVAKLQNSLMKRAMGYTYEEKKTITSDLGTERVEITKKEVVADVRAATILLVNLDPKFKTDRTQQEIGGMNGEKLESTIIILPDNGRDKAAATAGAKSD